LVWTKERVICIGCEIAAFRYRVLHVAARLTHTARRLHWQARSLLADAQDECVDGLDRYGLAMAVREIGTALALLDESVSGA
jgi:hypothetical protein